MLNKVLITHYSISFLGAGFIVSGHMCTILLVQTASTYVYIRDIGHFVGEKLIWGEIKGFDKQTKIAEKLFNVSLPIITMGVSHLSRPGLVISKI